MTLLDTILLVEDNDDDALLMQRALRETGLLNPVQVVEDGEQATDYLVGRGKFADRACYPLPAVVFLDLKLPLKSGFEVLDWIRQTDELRKLPVIVLTSSCEPLDLRTAYQKGATSYIVKPPSRVELRELAANNSWPLSQPEHHRIASRD